jgi:hypothetical protein
MYSLPGGMVWKSDNCGCIMAYLFTSTFYFWISLCVYLDLCIYFAYALIHNIYCNIYIYIYIYIYISQAFTIAHKIHLAIK